MNLIGRFVFQSLMGVIDPYRLPHHANRLLQVVWSAQEEFAYERAVKMHSAMAF